MSHQLSRRRPLLRMSRARILALALITIAGGLAIAGAAGLAPSASEVLAALSNLDLPRWVHSLADVLQILTAVIAFLAWEDTRRGRR